MSPLIFHREKLALTLPDAVLQVMPGNAKADNISRSARLKQREKDSIKIPTISTENVIIHERSTKFHKYPRKI